MKIRFKDPQKTNEFGRAYKDLDYLVLGTEGKHYYFLNENNEVGMLAKDLFIITDDCHPEFWIDDNGRNVPEEWLWKNFFTLNGEPYGQTIIY